MLKEFTVGFSNFLLSLSDAVDLASPRIASHQMRTAFIAWQIAKNAGFEKERIERVFLAALFHDIGALTFEEKLRIHKFEEVDTDTHCILGEALFELSPLFASAAKIVRHHHTPWQSLRKLLDSPSIMESQVIYTADLIERLVSRDGYILHQVDGLREKITTRSGSDINRDVADLFVGLSYHEDFWLDLTSPRLYSLLLHSGPFRHSTITYDNLFSIASLFRHIIDFKSRFTATHSTGVAESAVLLSRTFGLTDIEVAQMEIAGYFHDLGKLAIPNSILEKPGKLTRDEFAVIRQHTYFTYTVLNTIGGLDQIAEWAAFHHEKLNGSGYPFHIPGKKMNIGARIMAVADIFTALSEDRPYRKGMERNQIEEILKSETDRNSLDRGIVDLLMDNYEEIASKVKAKQRASWEVFEVKFSGISRENAPLSDRQD